MDENLTYCRNVIQYKGERPKRGPANFHKDNKYSVKNVKKREKAKGFEVAVTSDARKTMKVSEVFVDDKLNVNDQIEIAQVN